MTPDFVADARGVLAAASAMVARHSGFRPGTAADFETISTRPPAGTVTVPEEDERRDVAGRALAEERVRTAVRSWGRPPWRSADCACWRLRCGAAMGRRSTAAPLWPVAPRDGAVYG